MRVASHSARHTAGSPMRTDAAMVVPLLIALISSVASSGASLISR